MHDSPATWRTRWDSAQHSCSTCDRVTNHARANAFVCERSLLPHSLAPLIENTRRAARTTRSCTTHPSTCDETDRRRPDVRVTARSRARRRAGAGVREAWKREFTREHARARAPTASGKGAKVLHGWREGHRNAIGERGSARVSATACHMDRGRGRRNAIGASKRACARECDRAGAACPRIAPALLARLTESHARA